MSDSTAPPVLSSVELALGSPDGEMVLPRFWDDAMARYGARPMPGYLWVTDNVEWLMRHMMREPMIRAAFRVYVALVCEGKHDIVPAVPKPVAKHGNSAEAKKYKMGQTAFEFVKEWTDAMPRKLPRVARHLCEAKPFGHKLCEIEWTLRDGKVVPLDIAPKPRMAYRLKVDTSNRLIGVVPNGSENVTVPATSIVIVSMDGMDDSPTGDPCLATAYKPWQRKEGDLKNQGMSTRQAGGGFLAVTQEYPPQGVPYRETVKVRKKDGTLDDVPLSEVAAKEAAKVRTGNAAVFAPGQKPQFLQSKGAAIFDAPLDRADREMVMCFLGQYRTLLSSDTNSQADSGVAEGVTLTIRDEARGIIEETFNALFEQTVVDNLGEQYRPYAPKYQISTEETRDLSAVGLFLSGNWANLTLDQKNQLAAWIGLSEFPEETEEAEQQQTPSPAAGNCQEEDDIDESDSQDNQKEVAAFVASFLQPDGDDRLRFAA